MYINNSHTYIYFHLILQLQLSRVGHRKVMLEIFIFMCTLYTDFNTNADDTY